MQYIIQEKKCTTCLQIKPIIEFGKCKSWKDGHNYCCKTCLREKRKLYYSRTRGAETARKRAEKKTSPPQNKLCTTCNINKPLSEFYFSSKYQRYGTYCKNCDREKKKTFYLRNKASIMTTQTAYKLKNQEKLEDYRKRYYIKNRELLLKKQKIARQNLTPEKKRERTAKTVAYSRNRRKIDPSYRLQKKLRNRIQAELKGTKKSKSTLELLGCSISELERHLESQFQPGMTWDNHSFEGWHIDHIRPCASFDLSNPDEQKTCFHYTNLQPLWAKDNLSKGDNILN